MKAIKNLFASLLFIAVMAILLAALFNVSFITTFGVLLAISLFVKIPTGVFGETAVLPLSEQLAQLKTSLENTLDLKAKAEVEAQIKAIQTSIETKAAASENKVGELETKLAKVIADASVNQKALDDLQIQMKKRGMQYKDAPPSYSTEIEELLTKAKSEGQLERKQMFDIKPERKAAGDMSLGNLSGQYFITPDTRAGVILKPYEPIHMRQLLPNGNTSSNVVRYVQDQGNVNGGVPGMVAPGGVKPKIDRNLIIQDANVRKIAAWIHVPEEMIDDIPYLTTFLSNIGTQETMKVEDSQIVYGDGTGQNLSGLFTNATAFNPGTSAKVTAPNRFDVLRAVRMQMRKAYRNPSFALVSPTDYFIMTSVKDTTNNYVLQGGGNGLVPSLDGVPIIESTFMNDGDFLVGDRNAAEIDFRMNMSIRMFDQDQNNAITNMITIVIEERLALPIYYTDGFVKGTFGAAITTLTPA